MDKRLNSPFPKKGDLRIAKNYRGINHISIAAKISNALLLNCIEPEIEKILKNYQNGFRRNRFTISQILTIRRILERIHAKHLEATLLFVDFYKAFDSYAQREDEANTSSLLLPQRNSHSHNDAL